LTYTSHFSVFIQEHLGRCRAYNSRQANTPRGDTKRAPCDNNHGAVRFNLQNVGNRDRSRSHVQVVRETAAPPYRSVSFPASLNHIGRDGNDRFGNQSFYRGSSREQLSRSTEELDSDVFTCTCGRRILRGQITSHMSDECPRRLTRCQHCSIQIKYEDMQVFLRKTIVVNCPMNLQGFKSASVLATSKSSRGLGPSP